MLWEPKSFSYAASFGWVFFYFEYFICLIFNVMVGCVLLKWKNGVSGVSGVLGDSGASCVCFNFRFFGDIRKIIINFAYCANDITN